MDSIDKQILDILQEDGRISNKKLSETIGLNPSSTLERVKKLEEKGIIKSYSVILDTERLDYQTIVFIQISLILHNKENIDKFYEDISQISEITECYHISGQFDFLLKVYTRNNKALQQFLLEKITSLPYINRAETMLVFDEKKMQLKITED